MSLRKVLSTATGDSSPVCFVDYDARPLEARSFFYHGDMPKDVKLQMGNFFVRKSSSDQTKYTFSYASNTGKLNLRFSRIDSGVCTIYFEDGRTEEYVSFSAMKSNIDSDSTVLYPHDFVNADNLHQSEEVAYNKYVSSLKRALEEVSAVRAAPSAVPPVLKTPSFLGHLKTCSDIEVNKIAAHLSKQYVLSSDGGFATEPTLLFVNAYLEDLSRHFSQDFFKDSKLGSVMTHLRDLIQSNLDAKRAESSPLGKDARVQVIQDLIKNCFSQTPPQPAFFRSGYKNHATLICVKPKQDTKTGKITPIVSHINLGGGWNFEQKFFCENVDSDHINPKPFELEITVDSPEFLEGLSHIIHQAGTAECDTALAVMRDVFNRTWGGRLISDGYTRFAHKLQDGPFCSWESLLAGITEMIAFDMDWDKDTSRSFVADYIEGPMMAACLRYKGEFFEQHLSSVLKESEQHLELYVSANGGDKRRD
ncbi:hypothetical protein DID77_03220 [Candidatus Marinamargulisbacteria bacterium SCGC AG-439-L15]|nr:hypothetical protein DID77_03220 [Candidatus Marinamargulisbacteria bacterium SCGC AG-439-L15]